MKKRLIAHGIAVIGIAVFAFLAIASTVVSSGPGPAPLPAANTNTNTNTNTGTVNAGFPCTGLWKVTGRDSKSWVGDLVIAVLDGNRFAGYFAWHYSPSNEFVGHEDFTGEYNPQSGSVTIKGIGVTDPKRLGVGEYQARLTGNSLNFVSGTWRGGGTWAANFISRDVPVQDSSTGAVTIQPTPAPPAAVPTQAAPAPAPPAPNIAGTPAQGNNLAEKLAWLNAFAQSNTSYILDVNADESTGGYLSYSGKSNVTINLRGVGANRRINVSFNVRSGVTLILHNNITLNSTGDDRTVRIGNGGTLIMNGGTISGRGVRVDKNGSFTMNDGTISGNNTWVADGGVSVEGNFTMNGGTISNNSGGGVSVEGGSFTMNGGIISNNRANRTGNGGGVYVGNGDFTMNNGMIYANTSEGHGGGVYADGTFTMTGGGVSGNTAGSFGGGVFVEGNFTMRNGTISGNTARNSGGGVYVEGNFTKTGGTITGYASDQRNGNAVKNSSGAVQNYQGHAVQAGFSHTLLKIKEGTAGPGDNMAYNGARNPPTASGAWDN